MSAIHELAIRFADLWAMDHHQMVDEIYSPDIHMASMTHLDRTPVRNGAELHALEDRLAAMIPEHRHELVRIVAEDRHACLETMVVGPTTGEYAPACVWWWLDERGQVAREVGFFDWERRLTDARRSHGRVPANDGRARVVGPLLDALARGLLAGSMADGCVVERVGIGPGDVVFGPVDVSATAVDGAVVAALVTGTRDGAAWRGTVVLTLDEHDLLSSVRVYADLDALPITT